MRKIMVMNAKGGAGKTTIATNLASYYAAHGYKSALLDYDPQGSSCSWLKRRPETAGEIHGIAAHQSSGWSFTRSWQVRIPTEIERVIVDTPAAIKLQDIPTLLKDVNVIVVPVLASMIDVDASAPFIHDLQKIVKQRAPKTLLVVAANRVKPNSSALKVMDELFADMGIPVVGHLRDSERYLHCSDLGIGISDLPARQAPYERRALSGLISLIDNEFTPRERVPVKAAPPAHEEKLLGFLPATARYSQFMK